MAQSNFQFAADLSPKTEQEEAKGNQREQSSPKAHAVDSEATSSPTGWFPHDHSHHTSGKGCGPATIVNIESRKDTKKPKYSRGPSYIKIERPWLSAVSDPQAQHQVYADAPTNLTPMERWTAELTVESPYHTIGAVRILEKQEPKSGGKNRSIGASTPSESGATNGSKPLRNHEFGSSKA